MAKFGSVLAPWWNDRPVAIVAGGPSLIGFDFNSLRGAHVLAVKGSIFDIPWADAGFGIDWPRFEEWREKLAALPMRVYWGVDDTRIGECPDAENITLLRRVSEPERGDISDDQGMIYTGGTSGYGALQIALLKRATKIVLFGYDYNGNYSPNASFHHNSAHYQRKRKQDAASWGEWASYFDDVAAKIRSRGVDVFNACPTSAITAFRKGTVGDGIREASQR